MSWGKLKKIQKIFPSNIINIDKDSNESVATVSYKMKFIDSAGFVPSSLLHLVDNLTVIHKIKCKDDCDCSLEYKSAKDN